MRLATYEDAEEAKFLRKVFIRNGELENTVFAILSPDGKTPLARSGRGPGFRSPDQMARAMDRIIARDYPKAGQSLWKDKRLPEIKNVDLGINVASCDGLPVVLAIGKNKSEVAELKETILPVAWNKDLAGQVVFASALSSDNLAAIGGLEAKPEGIYLLAPGQFGMSAKTLRRLSAETEAIVEELHTALTKYEAPVKSHRQHVQKGVKFGLRWETAVPVTDRQAAMAAKRLWGD